MTTILLINRDQATRSIIYHAIASSCEDSHTVIDADNADNAVRLAQRNAPDLVIIDTAISAAHGADLCRRLRALPCMSHKPILFLLTVGTAYEIAYILDAGGDDCLRKPFSSRELAARIRALLRRNSRLGPSDEMMLLLNGANKTVQFGGREIELTPTEFDLLETLCRTPGQHVTTTDLLEIVWHYQPGEGDPALVRNHVRNLRRKLELDPDRPRVVTSFHGRGYTVSASVVAQPVS